MENGCKKTNTNDNQTEIQNNIDAPGRHPSVIEQLSSTSPPSLVHDKRKGEIGEYKILSNQPTYKLSSHP